LALQEAGLMDAFRANYRPGADKMHIVDKHAQLLFADSPKTDEEILRPEIDRGPLQKILMESLQPGTIVWDSHFVALAAEGNSWKLEFKNGTTAVADLVIAADGANSKLRRYITPVKPFFYGLTAIEGAVYHPETACPRINQLLDGGKIFAFGDEKTLIVSSKGDGSLVFYTAFKTGEDWVKENGIDFTDNAQVVAWFKNDYAGWSDIYTELFENADGGFVLRPQYSMPVDQTWEALPNMTMLGDAAHLMPPFAGEGVNMAMLDALELSKCLTGDDFTGLHPAIAAYEKQMRVRASGATKDSLDSAEMMHSAEAIAFMMQVMG
jgi:2-polyprenyl-6-methoxyphenol hydroxylase-like FAD-dependent oxidoreductase